MKRVPEGVLLNRGDAPPPKRRTSTRNPGAALRRKGRAEWLYPDRSTRAPESGLFMFDALAQPQAMLNRAEVTHCLHMIDTECTLKTVTDIVASELLSGGVEVYREGFTLTDAAREFYSMAWSHFVRRLLRSLWATGIAFVSMEPHETYLAIPHVLELSLLDVSFTTDRFGLRHYVVTDPTAHRFLSLEHTKGQLRTPLPGLMVFEMDPPSVTGAVQSKVRSLLPFINLQYGQLDADCDVLEQRRLPHMILTETASQMQANRLNVSAVRGLNASLPNGDPRQAAFFTPERERYSRARVQRELAGLGPEESVAEQFRSHGRHGRFVVHRLEEGLEATFAPLPQQPQHLDVVLTLVEERVGSTFGVPRSLFSRSHASYRTATAESSAQMLFRETLRSLKNFLVPILNAVFLSIYNETFVNDMKRTLVLSDNIDVNALTLQARVSWNFPGSPDLDVLTRLFREGSLTRACYLNALSHKLCIPLNQFEPREIITRRELAGIDVPDKDTGGSSSGATGDRNASAKSRIKPVGQDVVHSPFDMASAKSSSNNSSR